jgi:hypothetical protein
MFSNSVLHLTQEDLVHQLHEKGMSAVAIHIKLVQDFGPLAIGYSRITKIARRTSWTDNSPAGPERPPINYFTN